MLQLIESLPSAVVVVDAGIVAGWNPAAAALYGWPPHEVIGRRFVEVLIDESDRVEVDAIFEQARTRGRWAGNFRVGRSDGAMLVSSFVCTSVRDGVEDRLVWVATDVIDQHLAEQERELLISAQSVAKQELEVTLGLLEALLECAPIGIAVLDLRLYCTQANSTFATMINADEAPIGQYLDDLATLPTEVAADLRRVVTTGRSISDRRLTLRSSPDGPRRYISANYFAIFAGGGRPTGAGLTWTDVTAVESAQDERAQLARRADAANHRLAMLASTSAVLMGTTDVDVLLDRLARVLAPSSADWCFIELFGGSDRIEHAAVSHSDRDAARRMRSNLIGKPAEAGPGSAGAIVRESGQAQLLLGAELGVAMANAVRDTAYDAALDELRLTSCIVVPVKTRDETIGLLTLANSGSVVLNDDDLDMAVEIAHRAALTLERAITYRNEHVLAEQLQQALLPGRIPEIEGCRVAVHYSAAADSATVGGDWYDVFHVSPTRVVISVGDVVGHDTTAAVGMSRLRYLIHAFASEATAGSPDGECDPSEILSRIDRLIQDDLSSWATCVVGVLDMRAMEFVWSSAGHPPVLLGRDGNVRQLEGEVGTMLGVAPGKSRSTMTTALFRGDRLLMYTDGLFERRSEPIDTGLSRLADNMRSLRHESFEQMPTRLIDSMLRDWKQTDDIAVLIAEISGS